MGRLLRGFVGGYLFVAVLTRTLDAIGMGPRFRCSCDSLCWCRIPGLTLFRWVTPPRWHIVLEYEQRRL